MAGPKSSSKVGRVLHRLHWTPLWSITVGLAMLVLVIVSIMIITFSLRLFIQIGKGDDQPVVVVDSKSETGHFHAKPGHETKDHKNHHHLNRTTTLRPKTNGVPSKTSAPPTSTPTTPLPPRTTTTLSPINAENERRRRAIRRMAANTFRAYSRYAWGDATVGPVSNTSKAYFGFGPGTGLSVVNSLSTLWVMGLTEQFTEAKRWVETQLDLSTVNNNLPVFNLMSDYVGGLLSAYALTMDELFLRKAVEIAELVQPAFDDRTGLPYRTINPRRGAVRGMNVWLSQVVGFQTELRYLAEVSNQTRYGAQAGAIRRAVASLLSSSEPAALAYSQVSVPQATWASTASATLDRVSREHYITLLNLAVQWNDLSAWRLFRGSLTAADQVGMVQSVRQPSGLVLTFAQRFVEGQVQPSIIGADTCYLGALFARSAHYGRVMFPQEEQDQDEREVGNRHFQLAQQLTDTCRWAASRTETGLLPDGFFYRQNATTQEATLWLLNATFRASPELAESLLVLYQLTGQQRYRDYAWNLVQLLQRHCVTPSGAIADVSNVDRVPAPKLDEQHPLVVSATLKYLYLIFTDEATVDETQLSLPLDQWVFTSRGHPLPIQVRQTTTS